MFVVDVVLKGLVTVRLVVEVVLEALRLVVVSGTHVTLKISTMHNSKSVAFNACMHLPRSVVIQCGMYSPSPESSILIYTTHTLITQVEF